MTIRPVSGCVKNSIAFNRLPLIARFSRFSSSLPTVSTRQQQLEGYERLLRSSDRQKFTAIVQKFLKDPLMSFSKEEVVTPFELIKLIKEVSKTYKLSIEQIDSFHENNEFIHFKDNFTFLNLPYNNRVSKWSDRNALQELIRDKFNKIIKSDDLVIIPGCADGQIPIEVYANSLKHRVNVEIVAADFNLFAMQLGYLTMESFNLDPSRIRWAQTDVKSEDFFNWITSNFSMNKRHQIVTLIQPSLREKSLLSFLSKSAQLHYSTRTSTTIVMPVLLEDPKSEWYIVCDNNVQDALKLSKKTHDLPQLVWNRTKYGHEMLRLDPTKSFYLPQQYFVKPDALPEIREKTGYTEFSDQVFEGLINKDKYDKPNDPRSILGLAKRIFCIWNVKN